MEVFKIISHNGHKMFVTQRKLISLLFFSCLIQYNSLMELPFEDAIFNHLFNKTVDDMKTVANNFQFNRTQKGDVTFLLHLTSQNNKTIPLNYENIFSYLNKSVPTKFIIHGWTGQAETKWIAKMASNYLRKGHYNVIAVDWSKDASKNYIYSSIAVKYVGEIIAEFILNITKQIPEFPKKTHLIGHSLGAHVAGFVGKEVKFKIKKEVGRITGLDAAGPLFEVPVERPANLKLSRQDATLVDLIHTCIGVYGVVKAYGDVDFYVNKGGPIQPACPIQNADILEALSCSHQIVHEYFSQTILNPRKYVGVACNSSDDFDKGLCKENEKVIMGEYVGLNAKGIFYVNTH